VVLDLSLTELRGARLARRYLARANLSRANLERAGLRGANLRGADLSKTNVKEARYDRDTEWPEGFDPETAGARLVKGARSSD